MFFTIIIILGTLVILMALHEFGHFLAAKKFGVKVEEFGIGYPPRIWGKKIGETLYSINLIPFGAFVKILGSDERVKGKRSFSEKPLWQRALILAGGVVSFWLLAFLIMALVAGAWGIPRDVTGLNKDFPGAKVLVAGVYPDSPADKAGLQLADQILTLRSGQDEIEDVKTTEQVIFFTNQHLGEEMTLTLKRGKGVLEVNLVPRAEPPANEGAMGIGLISVAKIKYVWYKAPLESARAVYQKTIEIPKTLVVILAQKIKGEKVVGAEFIGPIGIGQLMSNSLSRGIDDFLTLISMIAIWLALFNVLPIPALDGGRLLFLGIEAVIRKPLPEKIEQKLNLAFFFLLIGLMVLVSIKDILRFF